MMDITKSSFLKYFLFASLYFTEGLGYIIASLILPIYLIDKGIPVSIVTIVAAIYLIPMTIKFIWGGIVDYFIKYGRRKFIILGGLLTFTSLILLFIIDPSEFLVPFTLFLFIAGCGVGFLDVSADAWAIEISKYEERGKINGAMFVGQALGMVVGASTLTSIAYFFGYNFVFLITGIVVLLIIIFPVIVKDIRKIKKREKIAPILYNEFKNKTTQLVSIFTPISTLNVGLLGVVVPLYLNIYLNINIAQIGLIITIWSATKVFGSLTCGIVCDRLGRKNPLYIILILSGFFTALLIFANNWETVAILYGIIGFFIGGQYSVLGTLLMDITNPKIGATQYSILTSLGNLGMTVGESSCGTMVSILGFTRTYLYGAWFFGPALLILYVIKLKKNNSKI